jgi:hypothetical protein
MSQKAGLPIKSNASLVRIFFLKSVINFILEFFSQTEFKPISKRQFETSELMHIFLQILKGVADVFRCFSETPTFYQNYLALRNTADMAGAKPIAV